MKCNDCGKDANTIVHYCGGDRCLKCDSIRVKSSQETGVKNE